MSQNQNDEYPTCQVCLGRIPDGVTHYDGYKMCKPCKREWIIKQRLIKKMEHANT